MRFGLGRLRLSPDNFWSMTPNELAAAASESIGQRDPTLSLGSLKELMRLYPDNHASEVTP